MQLGLLAGLNQVCVTGNAASFVAELLEGIKRPASGRRDWLQPVNFVEMGDFFKR